MIFIYIYIYTHTYIWRKIEKLIQSEEFIVKESQRYNLSVLINHHQDLEKMTSSVVRSMMDI